MHFFHKAKFVNGGNDDDDDDDDDDNDDDDDDDAGADDDDDDDDDDDCGLDVDVDVDVDDGPGISKMWKSPTEIKSFRWWSWPWWSDVESMAGKICLASRRADSSSG